MSFTPSAETSIAYARAYHKAGISVLPLRKRDKRPAVSWKDLQSRPQGLEDLEDLFKDAEANIGAICGTVSEGLLVLDHDDPERATQLQKYSIYQHLLERAPVDKTRRGWHIWVKTNTPFASSKNNTFGVDVLSEGKYCVAPPSIVEHKAYGKEQLYLFTDRGKFPPLVLDNDMTKALAEVYGLQLLGGTAEPSTGQFDAIAGNPEAFYGLGLSIWHRLKNPLDKGKRSEDEAGIVYRCVAIGWTFPEVFELFRRHAGAGSKFKEKLAQGYAEGYLAGLYKSAEADLLHSMSSQDKRLNDALSFLSKENPFTGRGAATDRVVLISLLQIQREAGGHSFRASVRRIAAQAGLELLSVQRSLDRLEERAYIRRERAERENPGINVLVIQYSTLLYLRGLEQAASPGLIVEKVQYSAQAIAKRQQFDHDAYRAQALGKEGPELLAWIRSVAPLPFTRAAAPVSPMYARRVFPKLVEAGILREAEVLRPIARGRPSINYVLTSNLRYSDLDKIAEVFGTKGAGAKQRRKHEEERLSWKILQEAKKSAQ